MHFQLFFPGQTRDAAGLLRSAGLPDLVEGCQETLTGVSLDPDETHPPKGLLVSWNGQIGYEPTCQKWIDCGAYWLGLWTDSPCTPADLQRRSLFNGYKVKLGDGNEWAVPSAAELPSTFRLVDRAWTKVRKPMFDEFWRASEVWYRRFMLYDLHPATIAEKDGIPEAELFNAWAEFAVFALRQNYRVTPELVSELGLLDSDNLLGLTMSVVDGMAIREVLDEMRRRDDLESAFEKKAEPDRLSIPA